MGTNGIAAVRRAAVALGVAAAALGVTAAPAQAEGLPAYVGVDGYTLNATAHYVNSGAYHVWTSMSYKVTGPKLDHDTNIWWSVKEDGRTVYGGSDAHVDRDIVQNQPNNPQPRTYGGHPETVVFRVIWDLHWEEDKYEKYATTKTI